MRSKKIFHNRIDLSLQPFVLHFNRNFLHFLSIKLTGNKINHGMKIPISKL